MKISEIEAHSFFENSPFCVHFVPPDASGRVRFGASGFLNGAKAAHHSLRIVRWWCKGPHRAISPPSNLDLVDFVDFVVQRHTPRGNFPRFLWTWGTCGLGEPVDLGNLWTWGTGHAGAFFSTAVRETGRRTDASGCDPIFCVRTRPDAPGRVRRPLWCEGTHRKSRPVVQRHTPRRTL